MTLAIGNVAPEFTLKDQHDQDVSLAAFRGQQAVVLCFYPLDWSPVCTPENQCLTKDLAQFEQCGARVLGISVDSTWSHKAFAAAHGIKHQLLADMQRTVCKAYDLFIPEANIAKRATVIVDKAGKIAWLKVQEIKTARDNAEIVEQLKKLR